MRQNPEVPHPGVDGAYRDLCVPSDRHCRLEPDDAFNTQHSRSQNNTDHSRSRMPDSRPGYSSRTDNSS
jgi:hypothetical protein